MDNFFTSALRAVLDKLSGKADKENANGGFAGGSGAESVGGAAAGKGAKTRNGSAAGIDSSSESGGAAGDNAKTSNGAAMGYKAVSGNGAALGDNAQTVDNDGNPIDAIQLGEGTNTKERTLQVYDYTLMNADGSVPDKRIPQLAGKLDCTVSTDGNIDGYIDDGLYYLDIDNEEYHDENTGISVVTPTEPFYLYVSRTDTTSQSGSWHIAQHRIKEGVIQRRIGAAALVPPQTDIPVVPVEPVEGEITEIEFFSDSSSINVSWGDWENYLTDADAEKLLDEYQTKLTVDSEPAEESANPVASGGVWKAISDLKDYVNDYVGSLNATLEARLDGGE